MHKSRFLSFSMAALIGATLVILSAGFSLSKSIVASNYYELKSHIENAQGQLLIEIKGNIEIEGNLSNSTGHQITLYSVQRTGSKFRIGANNVKINNLRFENINIICEEHQGLVISNNFITGLKKSRIPAGAKIKSDVSGFASLTNCANARFSNNSIANILGGIFALKSNNVRVLDNSFENVSIGNVVSSGNNTIIRGNKIIGAGIASLHGALWGDGISILGGNNIKITDNVIISGYCYGIWVLKPTRGLTIRNNHIQNGFTWGIQVLKGENVLITDNRLKDNRQGISIAGSSNIIVLKNSLFNNSIFLKRNKDGRVTNNNLIQTNRPAEVRTRWDNNLDIHSNSISGIRNSDEYIWDERYVIEVNAGQPFLKKLNFGPFLSLSHVDSIDRQANGGIKYSGAIDKDIGFNVGAREITGLINEPGDKTIKFIHFGAQKNTTFELVIRAVAN